MKLTNVSIAGLVMMVIGGAAAAQGGVRDQVAACIAATSTAGSYDIAARTPLPRVTPGVGGSALGAQNVNDCIADLYQVQYGRNDAVVVTSIRGPAETACFGLSRLFGTCVDQELVGVGAIALYSCRYGAGPMIGGNGYCVRD